MAGTLSATAVKVTAAITRDAPLAGAGTFDPIAWERHNRAAAPTGNGVLSVTPAPHYSIPSAYAGAGTLSATAIPAYTPPQSDTFSTVGTYTYTIPTWCDLIDVVMIGGGKGGQNGTFGNAGEGGQAAAWLSTTLERGIDIPRSTAQITGSVGAAGAANAGNGGNSTATATGMTTRTANGQTALVASGQIGGSPGNRTYRGQIYTGGTGGAGGAPAAAGTAPGAGGGGGNGSGSTSGGAGGAGQVNYRAYMYVDAPPTVTQLTGVIFTQSSVYSGTTAANYTGMNDNTASGAAGQAATNTAIGEFIKADCGATKYIGNIIIGYDYLSNLPTGWGVTYTAGLNVEGSTDNTNWILITTTPTYGLTGSSNGLVSIDVAGNWRYIRLTKAGNYVLTTEFQIWGA
jgi:hypothetical protein